MDHALMAWCLANSELDESIFLNLSAFYVTAPEELAEKVELAAYVLRSLRERIGDHPDAIETVRDAAVSLIESARHPPVNRKQLPENLPRSYIASDISGQFNVGDWLHTGRYRPAQVVAVQRHYASGRHPRGADDAPRDGAVRVGRRVLQRGAMERGTRCRQSHRRCDSEPEGPGADMATA